jgi:hypothetical protein
LKKIQSPALDIRGESKCGATAFIKIMLCLSGSGNRKISGAKEVKAKKLSTGNRNKVGGSFEK